MKRTGTRGFIKSCDDWCRSKVGRMDDGTVKEGAKVTSRASSVTLSVCDIFSEGALL